MTAFNYIIHSLSKLQTIRIEVNKINIILESDETILDVEALRNLTREKQIPLTGLKELVIESKGRLQEISAIVEIISMFKEV